MTELLENPAALRSHILRVLHQKWTREPVFPAQPADNIISSSVMFLLGRLAPESGRPPQICLILNKRSREVRQPGDLCCPGGTVETRLDTYFSKLLLLPGSPLTRWPHWNLFRRQRPHEFRMISLHFATALRESWEEMRVNPLGIRFLGPLPAQRLLLFRKVIHPMVGWVLSQKHFVPGWEVERIISIPLRSLLNPAHYANYRLFVPQELEKKINWGTRDFPCFLHRHENKTELLWGATYRIVSLFMELIFNFEPPDISTLPMVPGILKESYVNGPE